ncbi:hypothetical protein [Pseudomonas aeruginosa]|uniref:hypothetical protein n=1 Tax=Pseudomonas aeruginosa TaxID=287 RepID=UPI0013CE254B|nr:hypothetical protein [Pseudomonas aeruginosa]
MKMLLRAAIAPLVPLSAAILGGCSSPSPQWLIEPVGAFCAAGIDQPCLQAFAAHAYADVASDFIVPSAPKDVSPPNDPAQQQEDAGQTVVGSPSGDWSCPVPSLVESASQQPKVPSELAEKEASVEGEGASSADAAAPLPANDGANDSRALSPQVDQGAILALEFGSAAIAANLVEPKGYVPSDLALQYREAGSLLNLESEAIEKEHIERVYGIPDAGLRAKTLSTLLVLYSKRMSESQVDEILNVLYKLDQRRYVEALIIKLPALLKTGDLERAKALRHVLLGEVGRQSDHFSMLAYVSSCYTMIGLKQDAGDIVRDAVASGLELSPDDRTLIKLAIAVSNGGYPMIQDFYDFRSDQARLDAYLMLAIIGRQLDIQGVEKRALSDAIRFIQKSSVRIERASALASILAAAAGAIQ